MAKFTHISLMILTSLFLFISATFSDSLPPSPMISPNSDDHTAAIILASLGFTQLSTATSAANLTTISTPITVFAPADSSLITCPTCSLPLLLQEHTVPGLYPLHYLRTLAFGTKLETLAPNRCLTVTFSGGAEPKSFINGIEVTQPDLFNNGLILIHGLHGFVSHLSPLSCNVERMNSLSFDTFLPNTVTSSATSSSPPPFSIMRFMLKDAIIRLRTSGYSIVALALRVKYGELSELKSMTVFALDDVSVFAGGGHVYLSNFRFHVVPNRRIMAGEMVSLPAGTVFPTMYAGGGGGDRKLVVTTAGGGGVLAPMKINYVRIVNFNLLHNSRIVVHGVSVPFPHMHHEFGENFAQQGHVSQHCDVTGIDGVCDMFRDEFIAPSSIRSEHEGL